MSQKTKNLGLEVFDFATDSTPAFVNGVAGLENSNMHKIDEAITNKVTLNNESIQNVNFILNEIVQDGLAYFKDEIISPEQSTVLPSKAKTVMFDAMFTYTGTPFYPLGCIGLDGEVTNGMGYCLYMPAGTTTDTTGILRLQYYSTEKNGVITLNIGEVYKNRVNKIAITFLSSNEIGCYLNENYIKLVVTNARNFLGTRMIGFGYSSGVSNTQRLGYYLKNATIYNRILTSQEIQHNFNVLSNSQSISKINDYVIASDTDHVTDSGSILQSKINRVFYKNMCKEFSSNGEAITVNNGMDGYVLSGKIEGQTVKSVVPPIMDGKFNGWYSVGDFTTTASGNTIKQVSNASNQFKIRRPVKDIFMTNGMYYVSANILHNGATSRKFAITLYNESFVNLGNIEKLVPSNTKTRISGIIQVTSNQITSTQNVQVSNVDTNLVGDWCEFSDIVVLDIGSDALLTKEYLDKIINSPIPKGLNSTQAIISNNGQQYTFYEPTIQGETKVMKAPKGTQNWVEIDASEARDTAKYDYKLESINGDLGSVPTAYDYIDRARKVKVMNTLQQMYQGLETWAMESSINDNYMRFSSPLNGISINSAKVVCDVLKGETWGWWGTMFPSTPNEAIYVHTGNTHINIVIQKSKLSSQDVAGLKAYLQTNPITVRYQLATPIEVPLTDAEIKAYDAYKKVIDLGGMEGARNTLEIKEDGSGLWNKHISDTINSTSRSGWALNNELTDYITLMNNNYSIFKASAVAIDIMGLPSTITIIQTTTTGKPQIKFAKTSFATVEDCLVWLDNNSISIRGQLATPIVTKIDKSLMPAILTQATNTFQFGEAVAPYSVTIKAPTTDDIAKSYTVSLLNAYTQTVGTATSVVDLLKDGKVRLQMDLTAPTTGMNATLFAVAPELRPITNQKIPVFVNGVCQLATIDKTTGNVNLASVPSASANVYIKTDYRRDI